MTKRKEEDEFICDGKDCYAICDFCVYMADKPQDGTSPGEGFCSQHKEIRDWSDACDLFVCAFTVKGIEIKAGGTHE